MSQVWKIHFQLKKPTSQAIIQFLLKNRHLTTKEKAHQFFHPKHPKDLDLKSINLDKTQLQAAKDQIKSAIKSNQPIYIYGDYDADGITGTAVLWHSLTSLKAQVKPFLAERTDPVRGLSITGIKQILKTAIKKPLIITVDNAITAFKPAEYCQKEGIDLIITDHHQPEILNQKPNLPPAQAIVHTTDLAGAGVAWYLANHLKPAPNLLDLAALGTIADMVPLLNANRSIAAHGLQNIKKSPRPGIKALLDQTKTNLKNLTSQTLSFSIAPRLNAMGRLDQAIDALRLLCVQKPQAVSQLIDAFNQANQLHQQTSETMLVEALSLAKDQTKNPLIFIQSPDFHEGIVGLIASRLVDKFNKPAVVVAIGPHHAKASVRSIDGFNAISTIRQLESLVLELGGHEQAAGFTTNIDKLPQIQKKLTKLTQTALKKPTQSTLDIDCQIDFSLINWKFYDQLEKFQPFGMDNPQPVFATKKVKVVNFRAVGVDQKHLKLTLSQNSQKFDAIAFGRGFLADQLQPNQEIDIAYTLEANYWNNQKSLQLKIKDLMIS